MRARPRHFVVGLSATLFAVSAPATAVVIDWASIGAPGNACDPWFSACYGDVAYTYEIAKHEVTNAQYAEFLNAVADDDPNTLYNPSMGAGLGGITRSGSAGSYSYGAIAGREAMPVNYVDLHDTLRFANWLHNGQPVGFCELRKRRGEPDARGRLPGLGESVRNLRPGGKRLGVGRDDHPGRVPRHPER